MKKIIAWYSAHLIALGCPLVFIMMAMESTILPIPSEFVIPPAAHLAYTKSLWPFANPGYAAVIAVVVAGTLGSWFGATLMYWAARIGGPPLIHRYGPYVHITPEKVEGAHRWAAHYGSMGIFISRLLPVVRHLIGIPAGIVKMDYRLFSLYTLLGSGIWCVVLSWFGIQVGQASESGDIKSVTRWIAGLVVVLGVVYYYFVHRHMKKKA